MPTYTELMRGFEFGPWRVTPERGLLRNGEIERKIEPLVMDVFVVLASHAGEVVSKDQLIDAVWDGRPQTDDVITRCIAVLRRALDDNAKSPTSIETIQRRGYRVMQQVEPLAAQVIPEPRPSRQFGLKRMLQGVGVLILAIGGFYGLSSFLQDRPTAERIQSVTVFPFTCILDASNTSEHLCFGFAEEAIGGLSKVPDLKVVRNRREYEPNLTIKEHGLVTGSVQIIGDQARISAQLEDTRNGQVIWVDSFDADLSGIFALQRDVAFGLRGALDPEFESPVTDSGIPSSYAAAEAYSRGRFLFERRDRQSTLDAILQFEEAIRLDPNFGPAWLGLAYTYTILPAYDPEADREASYDKAIDVAQQGVEADPQTSAAAGTVYGFVHHKRNEWQQAAEAFETSLNSKDVQPITYHWYSTVMASVGRLDDAVVNARRALELDPNHPDLAVIYSRLAIAYLWIGDERNAVRYFEIANSMDLQAPIHSLAYSLFLIRAGELDAAKAYAKAGLDQTSTDSSWVDAVIDGLKTDGDSMRSLAILAQLSEQGALPPTVEMTMWVLFGEIETAMAIAQGLENRRGVFDLEIIFSSEFAAFRRHPEFGAFVRSIGLSSYWASAGCRWEDDAVTCQ